MLKSYTTKISEVEGQLTFLEAKTALGKNRSFKDYLGKIKKITQ